MTTIIAVVFSIPPPNSLNPVSGIPTTTTLFVLLALLAAIIYAWQWRRYHHLRQQNTALHKALSSKQAAELTLDMQLQFERMLSEISRQIIRRPATEIDRAVKESLGRVGRFLDVDRCNLFLISQDQQSLDSHLHWQSSEMNHATPGVDRIDMNEFPWFRKVVEQSEPVHITQQQDDNADPPDEAAGYPDQQARSFAAIPLAAGEERFGVLTVVSYSRARIWPGSHEAQARLIGEVFANALARKKSQSILGERLRFEALLSEITTLFLEIPVEAISGELQTALEKLGMFMMVDRGNIYQLQDDRETLICSHTWVAPDQAALPEHIVELRPMDFPWFGKKYYNGEMFVISNVKDIPASARIEREFFSNVLTPKSLIILPLKSSTHVLGHVAFAMLRYERQWTEEWITRLRLVGEIFAHALERQQAERAIKVSEEKFARAFYASPDAITITSMAEGRIVEANEGFQELTGYPLASLMGKTVNELELWMDSAERRKIVADLNAGVKVRNRQIDVRRRDGEIRTCLYSADEITFAGAVHLVSVAKDITEQIASQEALSRSEALLSSIIDQTPISTCITDIHGNLIRYNPAAKDLFKRLGVTLEGGKYNIFNDSICDEETVLAQVRSVYDSGTVASIWFDTGDAPIKQGLHDVSDNHPDLILNIVMFPVKDVRGNITNVVIRHENITEREKATLALQESEYRYRSVVEDQNEFIVRWRIDGSRTFANDSYCRYFGLDREEALGKGFISLVPEDEVEKIQQKIAALTPDKPAATDMHRVILPDGTLRWNQWVDRAIFDDAGNILELQSVGRDIHDHKLAEDALQKSNEFLNLALVAGQMGTWSWNVKVDHVWWSDSMHRLCGLEEGQTISTYEGFLSLLHPDDRPHIEAILKRTLTERLSSFSTAFRVIWPNGDIHWLEDRGKVVYDTSGNPLQHYGVTINVDERMRAEEALRSSEHLIRSLVRDVDIGIMLLRPDTTMIHYNLRALDLLGFTPAQIEGRAPHPPDWQILREDGQPIPPEAMPVNRAIQTLEPQRNVVLQLRQGHPSAYTWLLASAIPQLSASGQLVRVIYSLSDITRRKAAEEFLKHERDRAETYFNIAGTILIALNKDYTVAKINRKGCEILGYDREEIIGKNWFTTFIPPDIYDTLKDRFSDIISGNQPVVSYYENPIITQAGEERLIAWHNAYLTNESNEIIGTLSSGEDITERHQNEQALYNYRHHLEQLVEERTAELENAQKELLRKEKLATLGQLTAVVSHELRNPLGTIRSSLFTIGERIRAKELGLEKVLERAERSIIRSDSIIEEMLEYTREINPMLQTTHIDNWIKEILAEYTLPEPVCLRPSLKSNLKLKIDRERLRRCLINLLDNACEAMLPGKSTSRAEAPEQHLKMFVATRTSGERLEITIHDSGAGIAPEHMEKIFEPLFSTKGFGVGLGLSIVKQTMERFKGGIDIQSSSSEGTAATIWLPLQPTP